MTIDHLGPMGRSVADVALLLDVLAGPDGLDPRQNASVAPTGSTTFAAAGRGGVRGLRFGLLDEGFELERSDAEVDHVVRAAAGGLAGLGAEVGRVSVPWHRDARKLSSAEGSTALLIHGEGLGSNWRGLYFTSMLDAYARGRRQHPAKLPPMLKLKVLVGQWLQDNYRGRFYARAQNLGRELTRAYDDALTSVDVLVMPTTPFTAPLLPSGELSLGDSIRLGHEMGANTSPFNISGHPAISVPCGLVNGLPVGMMLVGRRGDDATVLRAAHAVESEIFQSPRPQPLRSDGVA
jgi:amidase